MKVRKRPSSFFEYQLRDHVLLLPAGQNSINLSETAPRLQRNFPDQETWAWILTIEEWVEIQAGITELRRFSARSEEGSELSFRAKGTYQS
jgi:hypothetical protein